MTEHTETAGGAGTIPFTNMCIRFSVSSTTVPPDPRSRGRIHQRQLLQLRVLRLGLLKDGNFGIGALPQQQEVPVGGSCLGLVSCEFVCPRQLQARQCPDRLANHDAAVIEDLLEFRCGFDAALLH